MLNDPKPTFFHRVFNRTLTLSLCTGSVISQKAAETESTGGDGGMEVKGSHWWRQCGAVHFFTLTANDSLTLNSTFE